MCLSAPQVDSVLCLFLCVCVLCVVWCCFFETLVEFWPFPCTGARGSCTRSIIWILKFKPAQAIFYGTCRSYFLLYIYTYPLSVPWWSNRCRNLLQSFSSCMPFIFSFFLSLFLLLVPLHLTADMQTPHHISLKKSHNNLHLHTFIKVVIWSDTTKMTILDDQ